MIEKDFRDKKNWARGPWDNESNYEHFEYKGYHCFILRQLFMGNLNGYVLIDKKIKNLDVNSLNVHGGITYEGKKIPMRYAHPIEIDFKKYKVIGFDCGHLDDVMPAHDALNSSMQDILGDEKLAVFKGYFDILKEMNSATYKDFEYVRNELKGLVDQILEIK